MTPLASVCGRSSGVVMPLLPSSWTYLLTLGDGGAGGHDLVLGHIDHGVALDQVLSFRMK